ncbi:hypothetical protein ACJMK2_033398 [Sinanodonta woodiana]|uniref:Uncharacterized protein n=1 Tax=Sinanodonta woodiana TaxID=1069815 RepID=A0ABD3WN87_SINWO
MLRNQPPLCKTTVSTSKVTVESTINDKSSTSTDMQTQTAEPRPTSVALSSLMTDLQSLASNVSRTVTEFTTMGKTPIEPTTDIEVSRTVTEPSFSGQTYSKASSETATVSNVSTTTNEQTSTRQLFTSRSRETTTASN